MIKKIPKFLMIIILMLLIYPSVVWAKYGDLNYRITNVVVNNENKTITFKGWAYIHRTNNYVNHVSYGNNGDQRVIMQAFNSSGKIISTVVYKSFDENDYNFKSLGLSDYNFYCDLFQNSGPGSEDGNCSYNDYKNIDYVSTCVNNTDNGLNGSTKCLYEDISFSITFDVSDWNEGEVTFRIGASNNDFENKRSKYSGEYEYDGNYYTKLEDIYIPEDAYSGSFDEDYISIKKNAFSNYVEFIAGYGTLFVWKNNKYEWSSSSFGGFHNGNQFVGCNSNIYELSYLNSNTFSTNDEGYVFFDGESNVIHGLRLSKYYLKTSKGKNEYYCYNGVMDENNQCISGTRSYGTFFCPGNETIVMAYGSHVKMSGKNNFKIETKTNEKKCVLSQPDNSALSCNNSKELVSTCDELTVTTDSGTANVKIIQKGSLSTVITPEKIFAGGGVSFGLLYTNTIKWNYVNGNKPSYHDVINSAMNNKIKSINNYIAGIDVSNLKIANKNFSLVKKCTYNRSNNYYNDEIVVSCLFTIPNSVINADGTVNYDTVGVNVNNIFYTGLDYNGTYSIDAKLVGLDRIRLNDAINDSENGKKAWTGNWDIELSCHLNVYPLLVSKSDDETYIKYIYRPVDLVQGKMFPDRNPGVNWFEWYKSNANKERLLNTYKNGYQYQVVLNNQKIAEIKEYNSNHNYLDWTGIVDDKSEFVDKFITRGAGGN